MRFNSAFNYKKHCFSLKYAFEFMSDLGNPTLNEIHWFVPRRWINVWFQLRTSICCCIRTSLLFFYSSRERYNAEYALQFAYKKQTEQLNNNNNNNKVNNGEINVGSSLPNILIRCFFVLEIPFSVHVKRTATYLISCL